MAKRTKNIILFIIIGVGSISLIAFILIRNKEKNQEKMAVVTDVNSEIMVRVDTVQKKPFDLAYESNGKFAAINQVDFSSETSGRVLQILVKEGDNVHSGQELAVIKADALGVDLENAQAVYESALKEKERFESAFKSGGVTQQQLDQVKLALKNAESRLNQVKLRYSDTRVKSTINGFVNKRYVEQGAFVAPGSPLFEIVDVTKLKLKITVNESQIARIQLDDKVTVRASAIPGQDFEGTVRFIAAKADNSLNFPVEIELNNDSKKTLKAGMFGTAIFKSEDSQPQIIVPRSAFAGSVNSKEVYVVNSKGKAILRKVVPGRIVGDMVEILDGLEEGEIVVTSGQINLQDDEVKVSIVR
ncbi:MAG: efflux RND transporter periplasmic adaptor subunit [Bacteroidota bacterium]